MICVLCGNDAIGYNYDVLSCGSCKAFFRRNANQNLVNFLPSFARSNVVNLFLGEDAMFDR